MAVGDFNRDGCTDVVVAAASGVIRFPEGGPQTIRIQTREDGVSVDAVVLSAEKYKTTRPGTAKDDTTKLQHQGPWVSPYYPRF